MKVAFFNHPFKWQYGKFPKDSRSPSIGHSSILMKGLHDLDDLKKIPESFLAVKGFLFR